MLADKVAGVTMPVKRVDGEQIHARRGQAKNFGASARIGELRQFAVPIDRHHRENMTPQFGKCTPRPECSSGEVRFMVTFSPLFPAARTTMICRRWGCLFALSRPRCA